MGRLVRIPRRVTIPDAASASGRERASQTVIEQDDYLVRIAKYVPAEVLAFSVLINAILEQAMRAGGKTAMMAGLPVTTIAIAALVVGTLMAPFFVWYVHEEDDAWMTNAAVSFVAFPFWSYAMGSVAFTDIRDGNLAAILLASFTVASGLIRPQTVEVQRALPIRQPEIIETAQPAQPVPTAEIIETPARPPAAAAAGPRLVDLTAINMPGP
jgi:hypothetical protein